jgi:hypothetical protein
LPFIIAHNHEYLYLLLFTMVCDGQKINMFLHLHGICFLNNRNLLAHRPQFQTLGLSESDNYHLVLPIITHVFISNIWRWVLMAIKWMCYQISMEFTSRIIGISWPADPNCKVGSQWKSDFTFSIANNHACLHRLLFILGSDGQQINMLLNFHGI